MTLDELSASVRRVLGAELPMSEPQWLTRTVGNSRQADRYRPAGCCWRATPRTCSGWAAR